MSSLKLTLKKEHTGKHNYINGTECPIAMALKDAGFKQVQVGGFFWDAIGSDGKEYNDIPLPEAITNPASSSWSKRVHTEDIEFELPLKE